MRRIILTVGIPCSTKSTWSKEEVRKDPEGTVRINRDDLRIMLSNYHFTDSNEKLVSSIRELALVAALKKGRNVILDETNLNRRNFDDVCKIVKKLNIDCMVMEKPFYIELEEAITRDAARTGHAHVGADVIKKFWKKSGGTLHKFYKPRTEIILRKTEASIPIEDEVNMNLPPAIICDLDGSLALFNSKRNDGTIDFRYPNVHIRSPYDASNSNEDTINLPVAKVVEQMYKDGHKIIFCSGREDQYKPQTVEFIETHLKIEYDLFMRKTRDQRKDSIIKEEIYKTHIKPNYRVFLVLDDRASVVEFWRSIGLTCFQVAEGDF